ncbi:MAG: TRAP transporter small permease subunit [Opitutae bacterium]|nr:TRAP transporter small permease subunit [Opitutae bacterium]
MSKLVERIEAWMENLGRLSAWMLLVLLASIVLQVSLNFLNSSITWMEELQWYLYGASAMVALSYTMTRNGHVRVEIIHRKLSLRTRQILEVIWIMVALIPLYMVTLTHGWDFMVESFRIGEGSPDPGGMPFRWVVKGFIPIASLLLILTALLRGIRIWAKPELLEETELIHGD